MVCECPEYAQRRSECDCGSDCVVGELIVYSCAHPVGGCPPLPGVSTTICKTRTRTR